MTGSVLDWLARRLLPGSEQYNRVELAIRELDPGVRIALLAILGGGLGLYVASVWGVRRAPRGALLLLRAVAAAAIAIIVLAPSLELQRAVRIPPRVAIAVDVSRSMELASGDGTRLDWAREQAEVVARQLSPDFVIDHYAFDDDLRPLDPDELRSLRPGRRRTDIARAIAEIARRDDGGALSAIVLLSDGADTRRLAAVSDVGRRVQDWGVAPVFPIANDHGELRDVAVVDLRHDEFGFVRTAMSFEATLRARGVAGETLAVTLRRDGKPVTTQRLEVLTHREDLKVSFTVTPERPGRFLYSIEVAALPGESIRVNNREDFAVRITRDQVRVLLVCGRPSWDERFLRELLKKDPNVDLVSFFILRDTEDVAGVPQDELSLIPFPVNDLFTTELANFDIVVLQNLDRRPFLSNLHLDNLRSFVTGGGGLLMIGGDLGFSAGGYSGTAIEDVLPFRVSDVGPGSDEASFVPGLTAAGVRHFITRLEPSADDNRAVWAALPKLDGVNRVGPLQSGSVALLTHPTLRAGVAEMPVLAARSSGEGRSLALAIDTSWYWSFHAVAAGGTGRVYQRFWQNAVRWLSQDPAAKFLRLGVAERVVEPDAPQELSVEAFGGDYAPLPGAPVRLMIRDAVSGEEVASRAGVTDEAGRLRFAIPVAKEGFLRVSAELRDDADEVVDRDDDLYEVRSDRTELVDPATRPELLEAIAKATSGAVIATSETGRIRPRDAFRLEERRRHDLWDNGWVYATLLVALTLEWWLRRRSGLV